MTIATTPQLTVSAESAASIAAEILVLGAISVDGKPVLQAGPEFSAVAELLEVFSFKGKAEELLRLPAVAGASRSIAVLGLGLGTELSTNVLRNAAGSAIRQLAGAATVALALPLSTEEQVLAVAEGAALGSYSFTTFRGKSKDAQKAPVLDITIVTEIAVAPAGLERASTVAASVRLVRDLVNTPGAQLYPESLAQAARDGAEGLPVTVEVWDEVKLAAEGCGGILGVGQGSSRQPRLIKVSYSPAGASQHIALVGKGITYDTGGYSIKPADAMLTMHHDMAGAATTLAATLTAARLGLPVRVTAWLCAAENLISSTSIRPNDVLTTRNGTTIEVINTDAEGRLVLSDGLALASEENPDAIVDVATLTGAAIVALGVRTAGVMGEKDLVAKVVAAGETVGEAHWGMPLPGELLAVLDSKIADIANLNMSNRAGGMLLAGVFLQEFIGTKAGSDLKIPWAHLDIAGTGTNNGAGWGVVGEGGTGSSLRTLVALLEGVAAQG